MRCTAGAGRDEHQRACSARARRHRWARKPVSKRGSVRSERLAHSWRAGGAPGGLTTRACAGLHTDDSCRRAHRRCVCTCLPPMMPTGNRIMNVPLWLWGAWATAGWPPRGAQNLQSASAACCCPPTCCFHARCGFSHRAHSFFFSAEFPGICTDVLRPKVMGLWQNHSTVCTVLYTHPSQNSRGNTKN
jgi:hypothetical protein